jgi:hypothetical protein
MLCRREDQVLDILYRTWISEFHEKAAFYDRGRIKSITAIKETAWYSHPFLHVIDDK